MGGKWSKLRKAKGGLQDYKDGEEIVEICECDPEADDSSRNDTDDFFPGCAKNPGHHDFIPVASLNLEHLPKEIRSERLLNYIMAHEKLVVKIMVKGKSPCRPDDDPMVRSGRNFTHTATGYAWCTGKNVKFPCPVGSSCEHTMEENINNNHEPGNNDRTSFHEPTNNNRISSHEPSDDNCTSSHEPTDDNRTIGQFHDVYGGLVVYTNHHVIYDNYEAKRATVEFFCNSSDRKKIVTAIGCKIRERILDKDLVGLLVCVHDSEFYSRVNSFFVDISNMWGRVPKSIKHEFKNHAIIISHPHKAVKQVTFGKLLTLEKEEAQNDPATAGSGKQNSKRRKLTQYSAATCSGSSGAPVLTGHYHYDHIYRPFTHSSAVLWRGGTVSLSVSY